MSGIAINALGAIVSKFASFIAQLVLGWLLSDGDFGIYAMCVSVMAFAFFAEGGLGKQLLARGAEYERIAQPILRLHLGYAVLTAFLMVASAPLLARHYFEEQSVVPLLCLIASTYVLNAFTMVRRTKLLIDLRFKAYATLYACTGLIRQFSSIIFALLGFGPLSFILPMLLASVIELVAMWRLVGPVPPGVPLTRDFAKPLLRSGAWIMLTVLGFGLSSRAELFIAGGAIESTLLGVYYWGANIASSTFVPIYTAVVGTFGTVFVKLSQDRNRQAAAFERSMSTITLVLAPLSTSLALAAPLLIDLMWSGKWNGASTVTQLAYLSLPMNIMITLSLLLFESNQRFRAAAMLQLADGLLSVVAAFAIYARGSIVDLASANLAKVAISGLIACLVLSRFLGMPFWRIVAAALVPMVLAISSAAAFVWGAQNAASEATSRWISFGGAVFVPIMYSALAWVLFRNRVNELLQALSHLIRRRKAVASAEPDVNLRLDGTP